MYTIIGLKHSTGTFKNRDTGISYPFDNIIFYVVDEMKVDGIGECPETVKVKSSLVPDAYNATSIGRSVEFSYNKYGQVQSVNFI